MTDRAALSRDFLARAGWGDAERRFLAGDASARSYDRLRRGERTAVLMDAPPDQGEDVEAFVRIARHLSSIGLSAPGILAEDGAAGFLLLEDLGDDLFARFVQQAPESGLALYSAAVDVLIRLQSQPPAPGLPDPSAADWAEASLFVLDWYRHAITGDQVDQTEFRTLVEDLLRRHADGPRVMILRDFHAENLLWLPGRAGIARVGLLDFQLAQIGQPGYDLVSLCQDARRDVLAEVEVAMIRRFLDATGGREADFGASYAMLGAQRALRILGVFTRLSSRMGKPGYIALIPRVWEHLQRNLAHPALSPLAILCGQLLPSPTADHLERIRAQCGSRAP
jgi:N-acetylmuramate 1-kinase